MATLGEVRARLRRALEDADPASPLWSDLDLDDALGTAHREYGARFPREATATLAAVAGQLEYPLPTGARRVVLVESPAGQPLPRRAPNASTEAGAAQSWTVFGGAVCLGAPLVAALVVRYRGLYLYPTSEGGDFGLPEEGVDLAVAGAVVLLLQRREIAGAKRRGGSASVSGALEEARRAYTVALGRCRQMRTATLG